MDRSVALAAKAFVSFFPLLILVAAATTAGVKFCSPNNATGSGRSTGGTHPA